MEDAPRVVDLIQPKNTYRVPAVSTLIARLGHVRTAVTSLPQQEGKFVILAPPGPGPGEWTPIDLSENSSGYRVHPVHPIALLRCMESSPVSRLTSCGVHRTTATTR